MDEGWIRFDPLSGTTQLLAPITRFVLEHIADGVDQREALVAAVIRAEPEAPATECGDAITAALDALIQAQLIQPKTP